MKKIVFEQDTNNVNICLNVKITFFLETFGDLL